MTLTFEENRWETDTLGQAGSKHNYLTAWTRNTPSTFINCKLFKNSQNIYILVYQEKKLYHFSSKQYLELVLVEQSALFYIHFGNIHLKILYSFISVLSQRYHANIRCSTGKFSKRFGRCRLSCLCAEG